MSPYIKRILIDIFLFIGLAIGIIYLKRVFIDFLISLFHFSGKLNVSSIAYCIQRLLILFLPLVIYTPKTFTTKTDILKIIFTAIGISYLAGNVWIILYILKNGVRDLFVASVPVWFVSGDNRSIVNGAAEMLRSFQYNNAYVFNYLNWNSYDLYAIVFSTVYGILYFKLAKLIDGTPKYFVRLFFWMTIFSLIIPLVYTFAVKGGFLLDSIWTDKNIWLFAENLFVYAALKLSSTDMTYWEDLIFLYR